MLSQLDIKNFAIIEEIQMTFDANMSTLIGETGAGKSIIIDALSLLMGQRASSEMVRSQANEAIITGLFEVEQHNYDKVQRLLDGYNIQLDDSQLIIQRRLSQKGRNIIRVNGELTTVSLLKELSPFLVNIHGQHDQQILMNQLSHLSLLDGYAKEQLAEVKLAYDKAFSTYQKLSQKLDKITDNAQQMAQQVDILNFQINEIEEADINLEADQTLEEELERLSNFQSISDKIYQLLAYLESDDQGLVAMMNAVKSESDELTVYGTEFKNLAQTINDAYYSIDDANHQLHTISDNFDFDEAHYQYVYERVTQLLALQKKYGPTLEDVIAFRDDAQKQLDELFFSQDDIEAIKQQRETVLQDVKKFAAQLTDIRSKQAKLLEQEVKQQLKDLYMDKAQFEIRLSLNQEFDKNGQDSAVFYISSNTGENLQPLHKVASGGEQSRVILALKTIFSRADQVSTVIFDEIDTGVSGRVATAIGQKMKQIAQNQQVLVITHSPQIAALSDYRYLIEKQVVEGRTRTTIHKLTLNDSIEAIAKMIAGDSVTNPALENAKALLGLTQ
ncbi:DNA repair protein RecN [Holzapfeliella sp. He02]|uniref:DNA repair protein RecN n=1 Tax=Holzapfeliella saturejae TaxID=3082953 RepID=A0ABU8SGS0_9LACO